MAKRSSYQSYRGRSKRSGPLKILVVLLAILLLVLAVAFFWLQDYMVFTADGVHLELPFSHSEPTPTPEVTSTPPVVDPVVETTLPQDETPEGGVLHAVEISLDSLLAGTAQAQMEAAGGNAVLLDMKNEQGQLAYVSDIPLAKEAGLSGADRGVNDAIAALKADGVYLVARMDCFRDNLLPYYQYDLAILTNSGYRWMDPDSIRWVSPTNAQVRDYLAAVAGELAQLGFDEILLDSPGYPTQGSLGYIKKGSAYDAAAFPTVISGFYRQMASAVEKYDGRLAVMTTPDVLTAGQSATSGQTRTALGEIPWRIWLDPAQADVDALTQALGASGATRPEQRLVLLGGTDPDRSWATLS